MIRRTISPTRRRPARGRVRAVASAVVAGGVATAVSVALGAATPAAQADPGDTFVPIGSSQLVQSEDLSSILVPLDVEAVTVHADGDFSSCLGEGNAWTEVLPGSAAPISATWTRRHHPDEALVEDIAQAPSAAKARGWEKTLVREAIRDCVGSSGYDFHYGPVQTSRVGPAYATWALSYRGHQRHADGGVVVVRKGTNVAYLQVSGTWGDAGQTLESVAKVAADRLV